MTLRNIVLTLLLISVIGLTAGAQPQPYVYHTFTDGWTDPIQILFQGVPAEDGWIVHILCTGDDGIIDPPEVDIMSPNFGGPTGDDFLADPSPWTSGGNNVNEYLVNGYEFWGELMPTHWGTVYGTTAMYAQPVGSGTEPVINIGDFVYLRAFNSDQLATATWYSQIADPIEILLTGVTNPTPVFNIDLNPEYVLPVELLSFVANPGNNFVNLEWVTASETENHHFNIYRNYEKLVEVATQSVGGESSEPLNYNFKDDQVTNGMEYSYQLTAVDINGEESEILSEVEVIPAWDPSYTVTEYNLHQNYPNPFNPGTTIEYDVLESGKVFLTVYNIKGEEVTTLINGDYRVGPLKHVTFWNAEALASGIYFYQVRVNDFTATKKMVLVR